jgi:plastocyanin
VLRKLLPVAIGFFVLAAACGQEPIRITSAEPEEPAFFTQVVDFEQDVGAGLALSTDTEGNPHMTYLAFQGEAEEGEQPAAVVPGAPTLPAVKHAHLVQDVWTRSGVAGDLADLTADDETAIWVDTEGTHHIAWTEAGKLFYTDNPEGGDEAEPQAVSSGSVEGISIAAGEDGTPWVSFYQEGRVGAATLEGEEWTVEEVAEASPGTPATTTIRVAGEDPLLAYGDGSATMLARRSGNEWATETADEAGGIGVAMALDADGNPHLAYYDEAGAVKHAHDVGAGWEISDVADAGAVPEDGGAAIVLDSEGIHHVAWQTSEGIGYASNQEEDFAEEEVARGDGGTLPVLGIGADEAVWLGWMDAEETEVQLALRSEDEPLLALPSPQPTAAGGTAPTAECEPQGTDLAIAAPLGAAGTGFDTDCLAVPAGDAYTIAFDNQDEGQIHNVNVYTDQTASESLLLPPLEGGITGPDSTTYEGDPVDEPGSYFFQCDYHAATMTGTFVVAEANR